MGVGISVDSKVGCPYIVLEVPAIPCSGVQRLTELYTLGAWRVNNPGRLCTWTRPAVPDRVDVHWLVPDASFIGQQLRYLIAGGG